MIIPAGFAQVTHIFTSGFLPFGAVCTYGIDVQGTPDGPVEVAATCYANFQAFVVGALNNTVNHAACRVKFGPNNIGPAGEFTGEGVGGAGGTPAPPNLAYLIEKHTALGGRQGRGRFFLPGVTEAAVDGGGNLDSTLLADFAGNLGDWFAAMLADDLPPVLLHGNNLAPTDLTSLSPDPRAATQRQRMRR